MKTYCKNVDVESPELVERGLRRCIACKCNRAGLQSYLARTAKMPLRQVAATLAEGGAALDELCRTVAAKLAEEIATRTVTLRPIRYRAIYDTISGKMRQIGTQSIKACILDHVAVLALEDMLRRVGEYQVASIPGRGQVYGAKRVARWLANPSMRYYVKLDVRKCYESIDTSRLFDFVARHTRNVALRYLVRTLLETHQHGLSIGSYLSQWLCNLYLSQAYHYATESLARVRRRKDGSTQRVPLVQHVLFYMDDLLLLGRNRRDVQRAAELLEGYLATNLGLTVKPWQLRDVDRVQGGKRGYIDMMGYRCHRGWLTIRRRVWRRARRSICRAFAQLRQRGRVALSSARRVSSYYGYIVNSAASTIMRRYPVRAVMAACSACISAAAA